MPKRAILQDRPITAQEQRFALWVAVLGDRGGAEAARRAGFSAKSARKQAWELMQRERVQRAVAEAEREIAERAEAARTEMLQSAATVAAFEAVTREEVVNGLRENARRAMQADKWDGNVALRAFELLGKDIGMFRERVEHTGAGGGAIEVTVTRRLIHVAPTDDLPPAVAARMGAVSGN